ncbi:MAG: HlyD family secretion protein [Terriglobia bacterium]
MTRKVLVLVLILVVAASAVVYFVTTARAHGLTLTGIVTTNEVLVSSEISGRITQLHVREGDQVKQGELLAIINPQPYRADESYYIHNEQSFAAQVRQAEAALRYQELQTRNQVEQARASLAAAQAQQAQAAADLQNDAINYKRNQALFTQGVISAQAIDQTKATYKAAKAQWDSLGKQVEAQRAALALAESNEEQNLVRESQLVSTRRQMAASAAQVQKASVMLDETQVAAPESGIVDVRAALLGEVVNSGQVIVSIINPDDLWVRLDVPETYISRIRLGDHFQVRFPSGMEKTGTVFFRGVDADYATERDVSRTKRDIKTFEVRLRVDNRDRRIWPGLTAYVTLPWRDLR